MASSNTLTITGSALPDERLQYNAAGQVEIKLKISCWGDTTWRCRRGSSCCGQPFCVTFVGSPFRGGRDFERRLYGVESRSQKCRCGSSTIGESLRSAGCFALESRHRRSNGCSGTLT